jgi:hypothetical protein
MVDFSCGFLVVEIVQLTGRISGFRPGMDAIESKLKKEMDV